MESLNKKALVELVAQKTGNTKKDTTDLVDHVFEEIANALKGSKAIIEKADYGVIALPATSQDLKLLSKIYESGFYKIPNYCYHIFHVDN